MFQESKELIVTTAPSGQWHALAEAIRAGCKLLPEQAFGRNQDGPSTGCALWAAIKAGYNSDILYGASCPECGGYETSVVAHLNDAHRWTRESIADWLDAL